MAKFQVRSTVGVVTETFRMGSKATPIVDADKGKAVTLAARSQVNLASEGDEIFGFVSSVESGTQDGFKIGGVQVNDYADVDTDSLPVGTRVVVASNPLTGTAGLTKVKAIVVDPDVYAPNTYVWVVVEDGVVRKV